MNKKINKKIIIIGVIVLAGLLILGGTYALLKYTLDVTDGNINGAVECFEIEYNISNEAGSVDNTKITGTLFPSMEPNGGLSGRVTINVKNTCNVKGIGTLSLHVSNGTSSDLLQNVGAHCENKYTLETLNDYATSGECSTDTNGIWVSNGTGIKYAVYTNSNGTGNPVGIGYVTANDIDKDIPIYTGFTVDSTVRQYYIFIWMDGYVTDESHAELPFGGYIHASVMQSE